MYHGGPNREKSVMPHFSCPPCKIRLHAQAPDPDRPECPQCGAELDRVGNLSQLVGYRAVTLDAGADRWLDDAGTFAAEAIAVSLPRPLD